MAQAGLLELKLELFLRMRNQSQIVWKTKCGNEVPINEMTDKHLINTIKMIERQARREMEEQEEFYAIHSDLIGLDPNDLC